MSAHHGAGNHPSASVKRRRPRPKATTTPAMSTPKSNRLEPESRLGEFERELLDAATLEGMSVGCVRVSSPGDDTLAKRSSAESRAWNAHCALATCGAGVGALVAGSSSAGPPDGALLGGAEGGGGGVSCATTGASGARTGAGSASTTPETTGCTGGGNTCVTGGRTCCVTAGKSMGSCTSRSSFDSGGAGKSTGGAADSLATPSLGKAGSGVDDPGGVPGSLDCADAADAPRRSHKANASAPRRRKPPRSATLRPLSAAGAALGLSITHYLASAGRRIACSYPGSHFGQTGATP